jgi:glycosyltransferase involved in cell wall biosynthesis
VKRRIRILFFIDSLNDAGGTENQLIEIVRRADQQRFELFVACLEDGERLCELTATPLVFPVRSVFSLRGLRQLWLCSRQMRRHQIDIVHTFMVKSTLLGVVAARCANCRIVITSRRNLGYWYSPFYIRVFRLLNRLTTRIAANSEAAKRTAVGIEGVTADRVDVLYNGVDLSRFAGGGNPDFLEKLGIPRGAAVVGIVANYRLVKDLPLFLRAARLIAERHPDVMFLLAGRGALRQELGRLAQELGIEHRVFFTDGAGDVADYLPLLRVGCLSSASESFSNAILEYMASGLPVVATNVGGAAEVVENKVTGYLLSTREPEEFAGYVSRLLEDEPLRQKMGAKGLERCRLKFDIDSCVRRMEEYYERLAQSYGLPLE